MRPDVGDASHALERARESLRELSLYSTDRAPAEVPLADNTNAWGMPPAAARALAAAGAAGSSYPSPYGEALKEALAGRLAVPVDALVTGCGSDDVLFSAMRAFGAPGARIAFTVPTFSMVPVFARVNGLEPVPVPPGAGLVPDADALLATGAEIVYLCSPNNPTGTVVPPDTLRRVLERAAGLVIVDEAYVEFAGESLATRAPSLGNVLVARTLSKAFGLAGLRVGYGVGAPALVEAVEKARGPYKVNALGERAAVAALTEGGAWVEEHVALAVEARERLAERLRGLGLAPLPSAANFLLVPVPAAPGAVELARRMRVQGVAVRPFAALPVVGDALRISVGPWPLVERAVAALARAMRGAAGDVEGA
ncbi:MAG TPA: histidinol-phosphate transaminase [Gemmatimonadaceae bacterium]